MAVKPQSGLVRLPTWGVQHQWIRLAWANGRAEAVWEPRVERICKALDVLEVASVYHGLRNSAIVFRAPDELADMVPEVLKHGCVALPLSIQGDAGTGQTQATQYVPGRPSWFRTVVTREPQAWTDVASNRLVNDVRIGELLGYPKCCIEFYKRVWIEEDWRDLTYRMAEGGTDGPVEANMLLRWVGLRFVRHLPCSFRCEETVRIAREYEALGKTLGFTEEMTWLREALSWNVEWTSLHGIAEIRTPILKISTDTDPLANKAVVRKPGTVYPEEGATGLEFPFEPPTKLKVTESKSFKAALAVAPAGPGEWTENGFQSEQAMNSAHATLLMALRQVPVTPSSVLDLGCGNGKLLERIATLFPAATLHGVELERERARHAYERLVHAFIHNCNIFDFDQWAQQSYDLIIFMPGRLNETPVLGNRMRMIAELCKAKYVLQYAYGDRKAEGFAASLGFDTLYEFDNENAKVQLLENIALCQKADLVTTV